MRQSTLITWRFGFLCTLGLLHACGKPSKASNVGAVKPNSTSTGSSTGDVITGTTTRSPSKPAARTTAGGTAGSSPARPACAGDQPLGGEGNLRRCDDGTTHRVANNQCKSSVPRAGMRQDAPAGTPARQDDMQCVEDTDCSAKLYGYCVGTAGAQVPGWYTSCHYGCVSDSDCSTGQVCDCGDPVGTCVTADCATDADCSGTSACARYIHSTGCGVRVGFACTTDKDECRTNEDCANGTCAGNAKGFSCRQASCAIGRPFLVAQVERVAQLVSSDDWCEERPVSPRDGMLDEERQLSVEQRSLLAERWARIALMEHASIGAFARFTLQLLSLGAPQELIAASNQAQVDETRHANAAFAIASRYADSPLGPGPLCIEDALAQSDLQSIALNVLLEGCIGETVAAVEAQECARTCRDTHIRQTLKQIEVDEARHAELAWRFVRWAIAERPELMVQLEQLLHSELRSARSTAGLDAPGYDGEQQTKSSPVLRVAQGNAGESPRPSSAWLGAHGLMSERERKRLRAEALQHVVLPCFESMRHTLPESALVA